MRLCSYTVKHDKGFAPNPFWCYCTLAACASNHQGGVRLECSDWLVAMEDTNHGNKLLYKMEVHERLHFVEYFTDSKFQKNKLVMTGTWRQRCGDDIYYMQNRKWKQLPTLYLFGRAHLKKDTKYPYVFIGRRFYCFGENAVPISEQFGTLIKDRQGTKCSHDANV